MPTLLLLEVSDFCFIYLTTNSGEVQNFARFFGGDRDETKVESTMHHQALD